MANVKYDASYILKALSVQLFFCYKIESMGEKVIVRGKKQQGEEKYQDNEGMGGRSN